MAEYRQQAPDGLHGVDGMRRVKARSLSAAYLLYTRPIPGLVAAPWRYHVHGPGHSRGNVVALAEVFLVELFKYAEPLDGQPPDLAHGQGRCVVTTRLDRLEAGTPEDLDLLPGPGSC